MKLTQVIQKIATLKNLLVALPLENILDDFTKLGQTLTLKLRCLRLDTLTKVLFDINNDTDKELAQYPDNLREEILAQKMGAIKNELFKIDKKKNMPKWTKVCL